MSDQVNSGFMLQYAGGWLRRTLAVAAAIVSFNASAAAPSYWAINPEPAFQDLFGISTRWVGDTLAVGAMWDKVGTAAKAGAVYLYDVPATKGSLGAPLVKLQSPLPVAGAEFGGALAAAGTVLAVGSAWAGYNTFRPGAVYLYDGDRTSPTFGAFLGALRNPRPDSFDEFGFSVVAVGNNLLVGAFADGSLAPGAGAAYLFNADRTSPDFRKLIATFENPAPGANDHFGVAATAVGDGNVAIGAFRDDAAGADSGAVYLFDARPSSPTFGALLHTFHNPRPSPTGVNGQNDEFGHALASSGDYLFVSSFREDAGAPDSGAVYMFDANPLSPRFGELLRTFDPPRPVPGANFGFALSARNGSLYVGAWAESTATQPAAGAVYRFNADPSSAAFGQVIATYSNPIGAAHELFGAAVDAGDKGIAVGLPGAGLVGGVYVFGPD